MDTVPDLIYAKDTSSRFVRLNRATARVLGVAAPEDAVGKTDADFFPDALVREYLEDERRVLATASPSSTSSSGRAKTTPRPAGS
jgi:PAS domain-containing protein